MFPFYTFQEKHDQDTIPSFIGGIIDTKCLINIFIRMSDKMFMITSLTENILISMNCNICFNNVPTFQHQTKIILEVDIIFQKQNEM